MMIRMPTPPLSAYARPTLAAGVLAGSWGGWVAAGALPPARRRLVRGAALTLVAASTTLDPDTPPAVPEREAPERKAPERKAPERKANIPGRFIAPVLAIAVGLQIGSAVLERRLRARWLARLIRDGHRHPYAALGRRQAALVLALTLPFNLVDLHLDPR